MISVNLPPPPTAERPESFEERQDDLKEFRDNADGYLIIYLSIYVTISSLSLSLSPVEFHHAISFVCIAQRTVTGLISVRKTHSFVVILAMSAKIVEENMVVMIVPTVQL